MGLKTTTNRKHPDTLNKEKEQEKAVEDKIIGIMTRIAASPDGHEFFLFLKSYCQFEGLSFDPQNPTVTAFREGRKSVYLDLRKYIDPKILINIERKDEQYGRRSNSK